MSLPSTEAFKTGNFFKAWTAALTKKLIKPNLTPCSFSKRSCIRLRISMTGAILISLNVVKIALVDCDCNKRSATRARKRVIGTRCSGRSPRFTAGPLTAGNALVGTPVGITAAAAGLATADKTSPLVTRPSLPEPATDPAAMLLSAINLAAAGIATPALLLEAGALACETGADTGAAEFAGADAGAAATLPSVSMRAINCSAVTVPPSPTKISDKTPAEGAGTSSTTLSVSISIKISSAATESPTFFFHCNMVASATDSES